MTGLYAVIGGSGLYHLGEHFQLDSIETPDTPYGSPSAPLQFGSWQGHQVVFLPRHGAQHEIAPHCINYRANLWALQHFGVRHIIAVNAVGGIEPRYAPGLIGLPDQIIDYTHSRDHSFFDGTNNPVQHIDFTHPYSQNLRAAIAQAAHSGNSTLIHGGVYGCSNGPRLETAAEIQKMKRDGCSIIGMTAMPEAALARELALDYAALVLVVNWCAGLEDTPICMTTINQVLTQGIDQVRTLLLATLMQVKQ